MTGPLTEGPATGPGAPPREGEGILEPGERILWPGRPDIRRATRRDVRLSLFMALPCGAGATAVGAGGGLEGFGAVGLAAGFLVVGVVVPLADWVVVRHRFYTLTDRRAFIATAVPPFRRRLANHPIEETTKIEFKGKESQDVGTVCFAGTVSQSGYRTRTMRIGSQDIAGAEAVHRMVQAVREGRS